jgi:serine/threonine protein kinase
VVHCDLNPTNVLLTSTGQIRIADFGSAVKLTPPEEGGSGSGGAGDSTSDAATATAAAAAAFLPRGTADYSSPEILRGTDANHLTYAVDLWSFGCILYAMVRAANSTGGDDDDDRAGAPGSPFRDGSDALAVQKALAFAREGDAGRREASIFPPAWDGGSSGGHSSPPVTEQEKWREPILALLHPDPRQRMEWQAAVRRGSTSSSGGDNFDVDKSPSLTKWYYWAKKSPLWKGAESSQRQQDQPSLLAPETPPWLLADRDPESSMKDGATLGWSAFLL